MAASGAAVNNTNKKVLFKNCALITDWITDINNAQVDDAQKSDIVMPIYNLMEQSDSYLKTRGSLWQYYKDKPVLDNDDRVIDFLANNNNSISFKFKQQITGQK